MRTQGQGLGPWAEGTEASGTWPGSPGRGNSEANGMLIVPESPAAGTSHTAKSIHCELHKADF